MWHMLRIPGWRLAAAVGWGVLALGSGLGLAALAAWLIARAWQMPPVLDLTVAVVAVRALGISRGLCRYLERLATHDVALRSMTEARTAAYGALARAPLWLVGRRGGSAGHTEASPEPRGRADIAPGGRLRRGDALVRLGTDIDDLGAVVVRTFVPVAVALVLSVVAVGLLAGISLAAAAILTVALAVSGLAAPWLSARSAAAAERAVRADRAEFTAQAVTVFDHAAELRVAGKLDAALAAAGAANRRSVAAEDAAAVRSAWSAAAGPLAMGASVLGALLIGITLYGPAGGTPTGMTPMALAVLVLLPLSAFEAVGPLPAAAQTLTTARAALHRLRAVSAEGPAVTPDHVRPPTGSELERQRSIAEPPAAGRPAQDGVSSDPRGEAGLHEGTVIGRVGDGSWRIPRRPDAKRVVVVGPSGAGKTTLLLAWAGLPEAPNREVMFFAEDAHLFGTSVLENLRVARGDLSPAEAERALRAVGLGAWQAALPEGVHTPLVGGAAAVSGGQRRRILLARALVSPARVLLLDEPTEHLEAEAGTALLRDLLDIESGLVSAERDVVVVTHQLPADHRADVVVTVEASGQVKARFRRAGTTPLRSGGNSVAGPVHRR
ncbi:thiol reductant ABC exporter subunit CydC [Nocardia brevicatena]|uniref:thiol reductant ABC exporter subunit CydC n=1 Tax=Nocardia brevicatena TaxID=37327 RepID=UPI000687871C|nr:thiol reductant ABC exporter subunit CydC [Nocardia brevicatena]